MGQIKLGFKSMWNDFYNIFVKISHVLILMFVLFLIGYMVNVWGNLPKAQDDAETIEEAITRIVQEHNEAPTAHTGVGEAIDLHRKNDILDHPAQSVVGDKTPFSEYQIYDGAITNESWSVEDGTALSVSGHDINVSLFSQSYFYGVFGHRYPVGVNYPDADLILQFSLTLNGFLSSDGYFKFALTNDLPDDANVIQFEKSGVNFNLIVKEGGTTVVSQALTAQNNVRQIYRLYYEHLTGTVYLYEGATIAAQWEPSTFKDAIFSYMVLEMSRSTNTSLSFRIRDVKSTFSINV
jgi:hypothetical protein